MKERYKELLAPVVIFLMVAVVWRKTGIYFETNDDRCISEILSGILTGEPEAHTVYVNYLLALPLSLLYRITAGIPWYGAALVLFQVLAYTGILESVYSRCRNVPELAMGTVVVAAAFLSNLYLLGCIQYTSTAALLVASGYFCLLVQPEGRKKWLWFLVLELLSCCLRTNAMLMIQPMGILTAAGVILLRKETFQSRECFRKGLTETGRILLISVGILLLTFIVNGAAYGGEGWKKYNQFNDAEEILFDYGGAPAYEEVREILNRYQVTEADYAAYRNYMILDWVISPECAQELAAFAEEHRESVSFSELSDALRQNMISDSHWGLNRVLAVLWLAALLLAVVTKSRWLAGGALGLFAGKLFSWSYLLYRGRFPLRVSMPLLAAELLLLLALVLCAERAVCGAPFLKCLGGILLFGFFITGFLSGKQQYRYILGENNGQGVFMEGMREIEAYCTASPEKKYILDAISMSYYKGSALETGIYGDRNNIVSGNWYSNSPGVRAYNAAYLSGEDGIYFLVYDDGRGTEHPGVRYLSQETGAVPELYDSFTASHGGTYLIYYFDGEYHIERP